MSHFHPVTWTIDLSTYSQNDLASNPEAQAVFVHEYVHYFQTLSSDIGRRILIELVRISIYTGLLIKYSANVPKNFEQINLLEQLTGGINKLHLAEAKIQFDDFIRQLETALSDTRFPYSSSALAFPFIRRDLNINGYRLSDFPHMLVSSRSGLVVIPLTDRVIYENMARQVQRNYLLFNGGLNVRSIDAYRNAWHEDLSYVCLHDWLKSVLPEQDISKWTITLCQLCLTHSNPGAAFMYAASQLVTNPQVSLSDFVRRLQLDSDFQKTSTAGSVQNSVNELIQKWGSVILPRENYEMSNLVKRVVAAHNAVFPNFSFFAKELVTWKEVMSWLKAYGCPPVIFAEGKVDKIEDVETSKDWHSYLQRTFDILS